MARGLDFVIRLYLHHLLHEQAVKVLVTLFACAAASKHWRLIENMIITKVLMSWPIYSIKQPCFISKSCTFKLFGPGTCDSGTYRICVKLLLSMER